VVAGSFGAPGSAGADGVLEERRDGLDAIDETSGELRLSESVCRADELR
jgi:hypothetical protein